jgi:hypothetical protein
MAAGIASTTAAGSGADAAPAGASAARTGDSAAAAHSPKASNAVRVSFSMLISLVFS